MLPQKFSATATRTRPADDRELDVEQPAAARPTVRVIRATATILRMILTRSSYGGLSFYVKNGNHNQ